MVTSKLNTKLSVLPINNSLLTLILSNLQSKGKAAELEPCHRKKKKKNKSGIKCLWQTTADFLSPNRGTQTSCTA